MGKSIAQDKMFHLRRPDQLQSYLDGLSLTLRNATTGDAGKLPWAP